MIFLILRLTGCSATGCTLLDAAFTPRLPRFLTDPDVPGVEKLAIWTPTDAWLECPYEPLPHLDAGGLEKTHRQWACIRKKMLEQQIEITCPCVVCRRDAHTVQRCLYQGLAAEHCMFDLLRRDQAARHPLR